MECRRNRLISHVKHFLSHALASLRAYSLASQLHVQNLKCVPFIVQTHGVTTSERCERMLEEIVMPVSDSFRVISRPQKCEGWRYHA